MIKLRYAILGSIITMFVIFYYTNNIIDDSFLLQTLDWSKTNPKQCIVGEQEIMLMIWFMAMVD